MARLPPYYVLMYYMVFYGLHSTSQLLYLSSFLVSNLIFFFRATDKELSNKQIANECLENEGYKIICRENLGSEDYIKCKSTIIWCFEIF